jgi:hypothetical protein
MTNLKDVMPILRPSFVSFVLVTITISFAAVSLHFILQHGSKYWRKVMEKYSWNQKTTDIPIEQPRQGHFHGQQCTHRNLFEV